MAAEIVFDNVGFCYGNQWVLQEVSFRVPSGQFVSLVGPSGCGKTTILRLVAGLEFPTAGSIRVQPTAEGAGSGHTARLAYVFQDPTLLSWRNVIDNIALPLELAGQKRRVARQVAASVLDRVGLSNEDAVKFPRMLSGGMRMRVSLARSLVTKPDVMLLDEPFAALDDLLRQRMNEELMGIWCEGGWTGLLVTHNVPEAVFLSQRVIVLGGQPCRVRAEYLVPFELPRNWSLRGTAEFARVCQEISQRLREER